jgi:hypothetical protein
METLMKTIRTRLQSRCIAGFAAGLLCAAPVLAAPAEYAFRWDPARGGPDSGSAVAAALGLHVDKVKVYRIDYFDVAGDPASPAIARRRMNGDKVQLTWKLRRPEGQAAYPASPTACALGAGADGKTEVDVTLLADGQARRALSFSCTLDGAGGLAFAPELHPVARGCVATMRRLRSGDVDIEEWSVHDGAQRLIEVSMKGADDAAAQRRFEDAVVRPLTAAKAAPLAASKTEFVTACRP